jgi:hypothetical protein
MLYTGTDVDQMPMASWYQTRLVPLDTGTGFVEVNIICMMLLIVTCLREYEHWVDGRTCPDATIRQLINSLHL